MSSPVDPNLDEILHQALEDFGKKDLLPSEKAREHNNSSSASRSDARIRAALGESGKTSHPPPKPAAHENDDFFKETSEEIDSVLSSIEQEDPALAKQLRTLTEFANDVSNADEETAFKSFSQFASMFKQTLETVAAQAGMPPEELVDDGLNDIMENLDKLASCEMGASKSVSDGFPSFCQPLDDMVKTLLAKDVMLSSLQKCEDEFGPWLLENQDSVSPADRDRYEAQLDKVRQLIGEYESQPSKTANPSSGEEEHFKRLFDMIADLQALGEFPKELMAKVDTASFAPRTVIPGDKTNRKAREPDIPDCNTV